MKRVCIVISLAMILPFSSVAEERAVDMIEQLHNGVCKDHKKPELCKRIVGIMMKSVQQNDDLYYKCSRIKPTSPEEAMYCQDSKNLREKISSYD